jgi:anaerobic selenocysteine-containing dehydrogenase
MDIVLSTQMLADPGEAVLLLPAATRYEIPGGVTETTTERRVVLSPEIPGPRIPEARPEWEVLLELARRVRPEIASALACGDTGELRREIAVAVPAYAPIGGLSEGGDSFQCGGRLLCEGPSFPTADGRAHFALVEAPSSEHGRAGLGRDGDDTLLLSTRRGKQFNSMVQESRDALTGALREAVLLAPEDATRMGLSQGDEVRVLSDPGELSGRVHLAPIAPGNVQVHWPEGNVLIPSERRSSEAGIPDYNSRVRIEAL